MEIESPDDKIQIQSAFRCVRAYVWRHVQGVYGVLTNIAGVEGNTCMGRELEGKKTVTNDVKRVGRCDAVHGTRIHGSEWGGV